MKNIIITLFLLLGGLAARAENVVSVGSASGHPQDEVTLSVSLANTDAAVAFQAEIPLGSQLTYVAGSVALNPSRVTDHQVSAAVVGGSLRIYAYSLSLTPFVGDSGNLLSFTLRLKNEPGDYALELSQTKLSNATGTALSVSTDNGAVTILSPKLQINTTSIDFGHVPIRSEYSQSVYVTNVGNEPLTISGIAFSDPVFSCPGFTETTLQPGYSANFTFKFAPMVKGALTATANIASNSSAGNTVINLLADPFAVNEIHFGNTEGYCDSIVEIPVNMNNMESIIGFQIDMNLPEQLEFVDFSLSNRKTDHVSTSIFSEGLLRLIAYSASGSAFTGDDGVIGIMRLRLHGWYGYYYLSPSKAVLADANGEDVLSDQYAGYVSIRSPRIAGNGTLDMGSSPVTETVTREYTVYNNGNASMRIDQVVFDQLDFSVAETFPVMVGEWGSTTLHVSYSREQKGDFSALMKIYSNDPQNGLKNVALSGHRYEPNTLSAVASGSEDDNVAVTLAMSNYSDIVALQANFCFPHGDYSIGSSDFQLTERFGGHSLYAIPVNDSTFRILVLSMQNDAVEGHEGAILGVTLHPVGTPSREEYTVSVSDIVLSEATGVNVYTGGEVSASFSPSGAQTISQTTVLTDGWNWWSTYIEQEGLDGLDQMEESLGDNGVMIKSRYDGFVTNYGGMWLGSLLSVNNESTYLIQTSTACEMTVTGNAASPTAHPISLSPGWNWIGYPCATAMGVTSAFSGISPLENDQIKSRESFAVYYPGIGWLGSMTTITPGMGLMFESHNTSAVTLVYPDAKAGGLKENITTRDNHWKPAMESYPDNMTVVAVVELDGMELAEDNYELAVFANGECRGSARLMYVEPLHRHFAFLTVYGEEAAMLSFGLYDTQTGEECFASDDVLAYETNGDAGSPREPYKVSFREITGKEEAMDSRIQVFPNPVECGQVLSIGNTGESFGEVRIEVLNALGAVLSAQTSAKLPAGIKAPETAGVYTIKVVIDTKAVYTKRLIVRQ